MMMGSSKKDRRDYDGAAEERPRRYRVTGHEAPLKVRNPADGSERRYDTGDEFNHGEWPVPHVSIKNALKRGLIEEV